ncbi:hypothetical protein HN51_038569 [Arachis hypogaea]|uniref:Translocon Sec61/SecY plug domain-containing protein n=1 Tax=Arachis hypogaea TaxID=3818 RepID=A0A444ZRI6_ARAHY|nr:protein transport protein Sec61 subunit alpha-like [Arachis hypogaea]QHO04323.1 Protein transport protein subunit alpha [Arachis hypogaea]RYR16778.1 hypothetical protein Ahy_B03g061676 [Arachis hypogaea]
MARLRFGVQLLLNPFLPYLVEVPQASSNLPLRNMLINTLAFWLTFLFWSHLSLSGIHSTKVADPFHLMRRIFASSPRTFMELGIYPIVISRYMMDFLAGYQRPTIVNSYQMILGIIITIVQAFGCIKYGLYGQLGWVDSLFVMGQILFGGITVIYLDQYFQKGYGLISTGVTPFIAANICGSIIWKAFSFTRIKSGRGAEFEGAVTELIHVLITRTDKVGALQEAFFRQNLPNVFNLLLTIVIFLLVVYFDRFYFGLRVRSTNVRGAKNTIPIKLFYTSYMPIILQSSSVSIIYLFSQFLHWNFSSSLFTSILGTWKLCEHSGQFIPVGGLAYYVTPPASLANMLADPIHGILYVAFMVGGCTLISKAWIEVSGRSSKRLLKKLWKQQLTLDGERNSNMGRKLNLYIVTAAVYGGMCIGVLTVLGDLMMGPFGTGAEIVLAATIFCQLSDTLEREHRL